MSSTTSKKKVIKRDKIEKDIIARDDNEKIGARKKKGQKRGPTGTRKKGYKKSEYQQLVDKQNTGTARGISPFLRLYQAEPLLLENISSTTKNKSLAFKFRGLEHYFKVIYGCSYDETIETYYAERYGKKEVAGRNPLEQNPHIKTKHKKVLIPRRKRR